MPKEFIFDPYQTAHTVQKFLLKFRMSHVTTFLRHSKLRFLDLHIACHHRFESVMQNIYIQDPITYQKIAFYCATYA